MNFRKLQGSDWDALAQLLIGAHLPVAGAQAHFQNFLGLWADDRLVGAAGLERYGEAALLRSVVVAEPARGTGLGRELVLRVLTEGYAQGVRRIGLLTTTAADFFPRFGFRTVSRNELPAELHQSAEFQDACPVTATAMLLRLSAPPVLVRPVQPADLPAVTAIYNEGIEDGATLETELRTVEERKRWLEARSERHPVLVAVRDGRVLGWASLNLFNARACYRHVADLSIYIERTERGQGLGRILMAALMAESRRLGYHKLVLATFAHSTAAVRLYESMGFRTVGDYREQGMLGGRWVDTRIMEFLLGGDGVA